MSFLSYIEKRQPTHGRIDKVVLALDTMKNEPVGWSTIYWFAKNHGYDDYKAAEKLWEEYLERKVDA